MTTTVKYASNMQPELYIAVNKNRIRSDYRNGEYVVFLENGSEFQLELFNKTDKTQKAEIFINGKMQSDALVLRPGQHFYLDRFMDEDKKLKFDTYEVDNTEEVKEIIRNNGLIEVKFYPEITYEPPPPKITWYYHNPPYYISSRTVGGGMITCDSATTGGTITCDSSLNNNIHGQTALYCNSVMETGRIEKGNQSNQSFANYYGNFQSWPDVVLKYHILPISQKPREINPEDIRTYCTICGRRVKKGWVYCAGCGKKI